MYNFLYSSLIIFSSPAEDLPDIVGVEACHFGNLVGRLTFESAHPHYTPLSFGQSVDDAVYQVDVVGQVGLDCRFGYVVEAVAWPFAAAVIDKPCCAA